METVLEWLPRRPQPILIRYGVTTILVAVFFGLLTLVEASTGVSSFFLLYPAIFLGSLLFDRGSGFLATGLSTLLLLLHLAEGDSWLPPAAYGLPLILFFVIGLALAALSEALRKGWEKAVNEERMKDLLYRELGHRTKNDLAMAASVLALQARSQPDPDIKDALHTAIGRLQALSKAHARFEPGAEGRGVQMRDYLETLCSTLGESVAAAPAVTLKVECDQAELPVGRAIPVGLIVNELVTNAFKHAFDEREGVIEVKFSHAETCILSVEDNGRGCPDDAVEGLGSQLVRQLVRQLNGEMSRSNAARGCRVRIEFADS